MRRRQILFLESLMILSFCGILWGEQPALFTIPMAGGDVHSLAVAPDGTVWEWGGGPSSTLRPKPVQVPGLDNVVVVSGGYDYSLALKRDGTVWRWESGGQPNMVTGLEDVAAIAAGAFAATVLVEYGPAGSIALKRDGTVWMWSALDPPTKMPILEEVVGISAGFDHFLALKRDGTVWAWGSNTCGQLGNARAGWIFPPNWSPTQVDALRGIVAIAAGGGSHFFSFGHSLALKSDGTVWEWGCDGTAIVQPMPKPLSGLTDVVGVAAGGEHSLALEGDGTLWAWGWSHYGQLGDGNSGTGFGPTSIAGNPVQVTALTRIIAISGGGQHSLALTADGVLWSWGLNVFGQLGDGSTENQSRPVRVADLPALSVLPFRAILPSD